MFYQMYELNHAALAPMRAYADAMRLAYRNPVNPFLAHAIRPLPSPPGFELFERTTRRYGKPEFGLNETEIEFGTCRRCTRKWSGRDRFAI
jgi:poly(3-hydroxybutyrate) depolymerase